jgi:hypothetical protein
MVVKGESGDEERAEKQKKKGRRGSVHPSHDERLCTSSEKDHDVIVACNP